MGINFRPGGLQCALVDANNVGIGVFSQSDDFGITELIEGIEYTIQGPISQFNGLTQINVETIVATGLANPPITPQLDPQMSENTESSLVKLLGWTVLDPTQWLGDGSSFNVDISNGLGTTIMRIDSDTELSNMTLPGPTLNVTGIGGQFDNEAPFLEGYQILPRYASDVEAVSSVTNLLSTYEILIYPNPVVEILTVKANTQIEGLDLMSIDGKLLKQVNSNSIDLSDVGAGSYLIGLSLIHI